MRLFFGVLSGNEIVGCLGLIHDCLGLGGGLRAGAADGAEGAQGAAAFGEEAADAGCDVGEETGFVDGGFEGGGQDGERVDARCGGHAEGIGTVDLGGFDCAPTGELPVNGGEFMDETEFDWGSRGELGLVGGLDFEEARFVLDAENGRRIRVAAVFEGVHGRDGFALGGDGAAGFGAVDARLFGSGEWHSDWGFLPDHEYA